MELDYAEILAVDEDFVKFRFKIVGRAEEWEKTYFFTDEDKKTMADLVSADTLVRTIIKQKFEQVATDIENTPPPVPEPAKPISKLEGVKIYSTDLPP